MTKKNINYMGRNFKKERSPDKISETQRSYVMSTIKSKNTKFEKDFLKEMVKYIPNDFLTNVKGVRGTPDVVFEKEKVCVFLDSDFWHGWQFPRWKHLMKSNFWIEKIEANRKRDKRNTQYLKRQGWIVIRIWEHNIKRDCQNEISKVNIALSS